MTLSDLPWHPMLVHFPIALFTTALGLEILGLLLKKPALHDAAVIVYVLAAIASPLNAWTGLHAADEQNLHHPVLERHELFALITTWFSVASLPVLWFIRQKFSQYFRWLLILCMTIAVGCVTIAAYNGGRLVYEYGIGIEE